jgi:hypothetical protein
MTSDRKTVGRIVLWDLVLEDLDPQGDEAAGVEDKHFQSIAHFLASPPNRKLLTALAHGRASDDWSGRLVQGGAVVS